MAQPFVGEIQIFAGNFAPAGWVFCDGRLLSISENDTLFNLIGTTYGGDGQSMFAVPDLRGRIPLHQGGGFVIGQSGGSETVTVTQATTPTHSHPLTGTPNPASTTSPVNNVLAATQASTVTPYGSDSPQVQLAPQSVGSLGGSQPHNNLQPFICINYIISLFGIYPSPN